MTYTINGKEYTELDINNSVREIRISKFYMDSEYNQFMAEAMRLQPLCYTRNPLETWPIIDTCWNELMDYTNDKGLKPILHEDIFWTRWESLMNRHKCTKLIAACICYIELNE